jgi:hypothetical protein
MCAMTFSNLGGNALVMLASTKVSTHRCIPIVMSGPASMHAIANALWA